MVKNPRPSAGDIKRRGIDPWVRKIPWRKAWPPTLVLVPGESQGQRGLVGYSPWGQKESDTAERLSTLACRQQTLLMCARHPPTPSSESPARSLKQKPAGPRPRSPFPATATDH